EASGTFDPASKEQHRYQLAMAYDTVHNIVAKQQVHEVVKPAGAVLTQAKTTYDWQYAYTGGQPHAPTHIGNRTFSYDANGNQTGWVNDENGTQRAIVWDEENRIQSVTDGGQTTTYKYDYAGNRVLKSGSQGETASVNQYFVIRNGSVGSKHFFAGAARVASKLAMQESTSIKSTLQVSPVSVASTTSKSVKRTGSRLLSVREKPADKGQGPSNSNGNQNGGDSNTAPGQQDNSNNDKACSNPGVGTPGHCETNPPVTPPPPPPAPVENPQPGNSGNGNGGGTSQPTGNDGSSSPAKDNGNSPTGGPTPPTAPKGPDKPPSPATTATGKRSRSIIIILTI
ncbi:MAG: hypothetical protein BWK78_07570, partial [Thiotrichaceae bacterium IS1]